MPDQGWWRGASGLAVVEPEREAVPADRFRIGSITKTYVAVLVLQLAEEGLLSLDDAAAEWVPAAPHGDRYTLRQLLQHTAGLDDYVDHGAFLAAVDEPWTPEALLALIAEEPLAFEPGTAHVYSNSHYVVLGMAIGAASGTPWTVLVRERILAPAELDDTFAPSAEVVEGGFVHGYLDAGSGIQDVTDRFDPSGSWAGGELIADADDLVRFAQALFEGDLLGEDSLAELAREARVDGEGVGYGLGLYIDTGPRGRWLGHSGSTMGFQSRLRYEEGTGRVVAVLCNNFFSEADDIDAALWEVLE